MMHMEVVYSIQITYIYFITYSCFKTFARRTKIVDLKCGIFKVIDYHVPMICPGSIVSRVTRLEKLSEKCLKCILKQGRFPGPTSFSSVIRF